MTSRLVLLFALMTGLMSLASERHVSAQRADKTEKSKTDVASKTPPTTPFSTVVRKHFEKWDHDHNGKLSDDEVVSLIVRPAVKGEAAAALATYKGYARDANDGKKPLPEFTLDELQKYEEAFAAKKKYEHKYDEVFKLYLEKIEKTPRDLFAEKIPKHNAIKQGGDIGDCYFISMLGNLVYWHPDQVVKMIEPAEKGAKLHIHFPGLDKPILIVAPTDSEIALNSTAEENGLWLTAIEKAFAVAAFRKTADADKSKERTEVIAHGGSAYRAIELLAAHPVRGVDDTDPKMHEELKAAVAAKCLMCCTAKKKIKTPPNLYTGHVYAVLDYDAKARMVKIWNPYGTDRVLKGPAGLANGYEQTHGVFNVPLADFVAYCNGVGIEDKSKAAKYAP